MGTYVALNQNSTEQGSVKTRGATGQGTGTQQKGQKGRQARVDTD